LPDQTILDEEVPLTEDLEAHFAAFINPKMRSGCIPQSFAHCFNNCLFHLERFENYGPKDAQAQNQKGCLTKFSQVASLIRSNARGREDE
jgi:hypothetical protein